MEGVRLHAARNRPGLLGRPAAGAGRRHHPRADAALHLHDAAGRGFCIPARHARRRRDHRRHHLVLFGVPGEATSAATVVDGYAMTKKGEAGRALGAALASSLVGAIVGAVALAAAIPVVRPLVLTFGSPELLMLAIVGLAFIASLSAQGTRGMLRGFIAGGFGLLLATVGQDPQAGVARFTFDTLYLWQGLDLVPVLVGIFAIPEIMDLFVRGNSIAGNPPPANVARGAWEGVKDTYRHFWLTIRCSLIGTFIGVMPG